MSNRTEKESIVEEIKEKVQKAKSIVILNYNGLTVEQDTALRNAFRKENGEYKVYKNRLINIAFKELNINGFDNILEGNTSIAFGYEDEVSAPRIAYKAMKDVSALTAKGGVINGAPVELSYLEKLSKLPSKETLIAQLLGMLKAPVRSLACVVSQIAEKKN